MSKDADKQQNDSDDTLADWQDFAWTDNDGLPFVLLAGRHVKSRKQLHAALREVEIERFNKPQELNSLLDTTAPDGLDDIPSTAAEAAQRATKEEAKFQKDLQQMCLPMLEVLINPHHVTPVAHQASDAQPRQTAVLQRELLTERTLEQVAIELEKIRLRQEREQQIAEAKPKDHKISERPAMQRERTYDILRHNEARPTDNLHSTIIDRKAALRLDAAAPKRAKIMESKSTQFSGARSTQLNQEAWQPSSNYSDSSTLTNTPTPTRTQTSLTLKHQSRLTKWQDSDNRSGNSSAYSTPITTRAPTGLTLRTQSAYQSASSILKIPKQLNQPWQHMCTESEDSTPLISSSSSLQTISRSSFTLERQPTKYYDPMSTTSYSSILSPTNASSTPELNTSSSSSLQATKKTPEGGQILNKIGKLFMQLQHEQPAQMLHNPSYSYLVTVAPEGNAAKCAVQSVALPIVSAHERIVPYALPGTSCASSISLPTRSKGINILTPAKSYNPNASFHSGRSRATRAATTAGFKQPMTNEKEKPLHPYLKRRSISYLPPTRSKKLN